MPRITGTTACLAVVMCLLQAALVPASAEDWPEWRGKGRRGVWNESGVLDRFPDKGLTIVWRTPLHGGFAGPAVADGRVYVTDFKRSTGKKGTERALCLDEKSGKVLWIREWDADYQGISYDTGPRATPTVDGDRVYVVGASGTLLCLNARTGDVVWRKDYAKDYGMRVPVWGISSAPLIDGNRLIAIVGGQPDAKVMAFDKMTGKEIWRALPFRFRAGLLPAGDGRDRRRPAADRLAPDCDRVARSGDGRRQLATTLPNQSRGDAVDAGLERLAAAGFFLLQRFDAARAGEGQGCGAVEGQEQQRDRYRRPAYGGQHAGDRRRLHLRHLQLRPVPVSEREDRRARLGDDGGDEGEGSLGVRIHRAQRRPVLHQQRSRRADHRELVREGYQEISRTSLIKPTTNPGNRRELGVVNWTHPAYANRHVITRNDEEIVSMSLAK